MKRILKVYLYIFLAIVLLIVGVLGYFGFIPGVSALFGSNRPRDLGMTHTSADLDSAQSKLGQSFVKPGADPTSLLKSSPISQVNASLTQEEYAAHIEKVHPIDDVQVKITGSTIEVSGRITRSRIPQFVRTLGVSASDNQIMNVVDRYLPIDPIFYLKGTGGVQSDQVSIDLERAELGRFGVPTGVAKSALDSYIEMIIKEIPGFSAVSLSVADGGVQFIGTAPSSVPEF